MDTIKKMTFHPATPPSEGDELWFGPQKWVYFALNIHILGFALYTAVYIVVCAYGVVKWIDWGGTWAQKVFACVLLS